MKNMIASDIAAAMAMTAPPNHPGRQRRQEHRRHRGRGRLVHDARQGAQGRGPRDTLRAPGPFTVFAPTDEAFAKLPAGTVETLLKPENKAKLQRILTYHVVAGKVMAADVVKMTAAKAVSGDTIAIARADGGVTVDGAKVVKADIAASNGVIHVIDTVIMPKGK